eukprot:2630804-Rhodomonas_salina.7
MMTAWFASSSSTDRIVYLRSLCPTAALAAADSRLWFGWSHPMRCQCRTWRSSVSARHGVAGGIVT